MIWVQILPGLIACLLPCTKRRTAGQTLLSLSSAFLSAPLWELPAAHLASALLPSLLL